MGKSVPLEKRFWPKVNKNGPTMPHMKTPCHVWTGALTKNGYGQCPINGKQVGAHVVSWMIHFGPVPAGHNVLHYCDNRPCVRGDHLWTGTQKQNLDDMKAKGREYFHYKDPAVARATALANTKVTWAQICALREEAAGGVKTRVLAEKYNVTMAHVRQIVTGKMRKTS